jgi:exodeoxyribonuclease VII large subunit
MQVELFEQHEEDTPVLSVSKITRQVRKSLEKTFSQVWVRGEVSNLLAHSSGHRYFLLKDSSAQLKAVFFQRDALGSTYLPNEGDECLVFGDITVYEPRGEYQLRVKHMMQDGLGNLRQQFELLKEKLFKERKKPLPSLPRKVAIVTSLKGAALQDFISILKRRGWAGEILIFGSMVQGREAPQQLLQALGQAQRHPGLDLIVLARGGGSIEDLWAFNDEELVRAVGQCSLPTISAIGHQTDFVLSDFIADFRAETPSAAAEWISSEYIRLTKQLGDLAHRFLEIPRQSLERKSSAVSLWQARLAAYSPESSLQRQAQLLDELETRMSATLTHRMERTADRLASLDKRLEGSSLQAALGKGFAYLQDEEGTILDQAKSLKEGSLLSVTLKDGSKQVRVEK